MKKSTKIILPALAVLVLGTAAAATGTVAWFAANGVVEATGMQVQCATSKNLLIVNNNPNPATGTANFNEGNFGSSVTTTTTGVKTLSPASTAESVLKSSESFFKISNQKINAVSGGILNGATISAATGAAGTSTENCDYAIHHFWVANSALSDMKLSVQSLTATTTQVAEDGTKSEVALSASITKALRVAIVYKDLTAAEGSQMVAKIYTVVSEATLQYQGLIKATATEGGVTGTNAEGNIVEGTTVLSEAVTAKYFASASAEDKSLGKIKSTTHAVADNSGYDWTTLDVCVWYEGQDAHCTSNDAMTVEQVNISVKFAAAE